ncbi:MAG: hypothetical protein D3922_05430, partial [Candidatus Electrothrix sp. AR1]|nr:hypothetical protein [Candidatus Electrothrix sp. AR1]
MKQTTSLDNSIFFSQPDKESDLSLAPDLPADFPRSDASPSVRARISVITEPKLTGQIRQFCKQNNTDLSVLLPAAFQLFLYRYTGQHDIVINTVNITAWNNQDLSVLSLCTRLEDDLQVDGLLQIVQLAQKKAEEKPTGFSRMTL